jgi:pimeloyl-ACP methyl ester carboxylesterase
MILHAAESGTGAPVALLHGLFGQGANFASLARRLSRSARVIVLDLRNHGASPHAPAMSYQAMAEDVLETLGARGALPCRLLGHSLGGKVAMMAALRAPGAVSGLLVGDIAPARYPPAFGPLTAAMAALPLTPDLTRAAADAALAAVAPPAVRALLLQNLRLGARPHWRIALPEITAALPALLDWPAIDATPYPGPALFVAAALSGLLRAEHRPAIRALFPAARFLTLKGAGHWLHADQPAAFASLAEAFLAAVTGESGG